VPVQAQHRFNVEESLEIYREPHFTGYTATTILRDGDQAAPSQFPDAIIDVAELLTR